MSWYAITKSGLSKLNQFLLDIQHSCSAVNLRAKAITAETQRTLSYAEVKLRHYSSLGGGRKLGVEESRDPLGQLRLIGPRLVCE